MKTKLNTKIEINNEDTTNTGNYSVWYKDEAGQTRRRILSEAYVNSLLNMKQKEDFFMGKYKFKISEYDFKKVVLNGEKIQGIN